MICDIEMQFDKNEFKLLVKLIYVGSMVVDNEEHKYGNKIDKLEERVLQIAKAYNIFRILNMISSLMVFFL